MLVARVEVLGEIDARGGIRFEVDEDSVMRGMDGVPVEVVVDNFSRTGFLFTGDVDWPVGTLVSIGLSGAGTREAKVVRRDGNGHGCEFLMPLARREIAHAFRGQDQVVSTIEAALARRARQAAAAVPFQPKRRSLLSTIRGWFGR